MPREVKSMDIKEVISKGEKIDVEFKSRFQRGRY